ncbi:hypothetical protein [Paraburkholderia phosphatilytica]|uniref:hypothetical protein n=1 Tax=Paraburkholderia phosphatilytica TaxID=2282883 RepID=UPI000E49FD97|nr:hypothetical protein [Paraburkholderia phosphatilytica]
MVVRSSDNVVGISTNDLVVIHPDTAAVRQVAAGLAKSVSAYPEMGVTVIHAGGLDQLASIKATLATTFPTVKFDLPVRYGNIQPK